MRIGIISDIHCNLEGLQRALAEMGPVDEVLCSGDMVNEYSFSNEVFDVIRQRGISCVIGNHESVVLSHHGERLRASGVIRPDNLAFLEGLPTVFEAKVNGKKLFMVHGSPWDPLREYLYPESKKIRLLGEIDADYVILGHTHFPMIRKVGKVTVINSGSCGEGRDHRYQRQLTYAVLDLGADAAAIRVIGNALPSGINVQSY